MTNGKTGKWTHFGEFFEALAELGIDDWEGVDALHSALRDGLQARGYRRQFSYPTGERVERLPRDLHPVLIPPAIWKECGEAKGDLTSFWQDDPDDPEEWIQVDWVSGAIQTLSWELTNFEHLHSDYGAVKIPRKDADRILAELAGKPKKRPGRPSGPANDWEKEQVERAIQIMASGDTRSATALANELTDNSLTGRALESQKRRLAWGISKVKSSPAKNPAKNKRD